MRKEKIIGIGLMVLMLGQGVAMCQDSTLVDYLRKEKFNLELYELSFCIEETLEILEDDSSYFSIFKKRILRSFDDRLSSSQVFFHGNELAFFNAQLHSKKMLANKYPAAFFFLNEMSVYSKTGIGIDLADTFCDYVKYPEQVDDICLIILIGEFPDKIWNDIQSNECASYRFNSWIKYGFEEFRYYPGTKSKPKAELNRRITNFVLQKNKSKDHPLIVRSKQMINSVIDNYK